MDEWPEGTAPAPTEDDPWVVKPVNKVFRTWKEANDWATEQSKAGELEPPWMVVPYRDEERHAAKIEQK
jgi:hypothetical protein